MNGYEILGATYASVDPVKPQVQQEEPVLAVLLEVAGGITAGMYCSKAWPAHPIWGFILGYTFLGAPVGHAVGKTLGRALS